MVQEAFLNITDASTDFTLKNFSGLLHFTGFSAIQPADKHRNRGREP
jgi:hypothetical protein